MKKFEINTAIVELVRSTLQDAGFKKQKCSDGWVFHKDTSFGYNEVPVLIWQYGAVYYASLSFILRIDDLNKIFLPFSSFVVKEIDESSTLISDIQMFGYKDDKIKIETEEDLKLAIETLKEIIIKNGIPFFDKYSSIKAIDEELNRENRPKNLYCDEIMQRPIIGITAAALNNNSNKEYWVSYYRDKLINAAKFYKNSYEDLITYLQKNKYLK